MGSCSDFLDRSPQGQFTEDDNPNALVNGKIYNVYTLSLIHIYVNLSSAKRTSLYDEWYQGYDWNYREDILYQTYLGSASSGYYTAAGLKLS